MNWSVVPFDVGSQELGVHIKDCRNCCIVPFVVGSQEPGVYSALGEHAYTDSFVASDLCCYSQIK